MPPEAETAPTTTVDTSSPEFQAAVAAATEQVIRQLGHAAPAKGDADGEDFVKRLALSIAELSDQGTQRKRVAPEILAKRAEARDRMFELLIANRRKVKEDREAGKTPELPHYKVINKTYLNETFVEPFRVDLVTKAAVPTEIYWEGAPNECMRPLNAVATPIFEEFVKSIGGSAAYKAKNSAFAPDNRDFSVTPAGLVVRGLNASAKRTVGNLGDPIADPFADSLSVKQAHDPSQEFVRVLGTVAEPARQNFVQK